MWIAQSAGGIFEEHIHRGIPQWQWPVVVYPDLGQGRSVVGGYVYSGASMPPLSGTHFYAGVFAGSIRSF